MKHSRHTDEEIAQLLREAQAGIPIDDICRSANVSLRTFYRWRKRLGGLAPAALNRLQNLESENRRLLRQIKKLRAEHTPAPTVKTVRAEEWRQRSEFGSPSSCRDANDPSGAALAGRRGTSAGRFSHLRTAR
jgi:putative transposase